MKYFLASLIVLTGCTSIPSEVQTVNIPVPVLTPCVTNIPKPSMAEPKNNSRVEWLRSYMINNERLMAYLKELEATLQACS